MSTTETTEATDTAAPSTGDSTEAPVEQQATTEQPTEQQQTSEEVDWKAKFEAQQKVTRDLEKKVKGEAGTLRQQLEELQAKMEGREAEHAAAVEAQRVKDEALAAANTKIAKANLRAAAAGKLADPMDALTFIDVSSFEVDDDGNTDEAALNAAIEDLITNKPYLAAQGKRFQGDADGGARKDATKPQITRDQLSSMTPDEINTARAEGRLNDLLGVTT